MLLAFTADVQAIKHKHAIGTSELFFSSTLYTHLKMSLFYTLTASYFGEGGWGSGFTQMLLTLRREAGAVCVH